MKSHGENTPLLEESYELSSSYDATTAVLQEPENQSTPASDILRNSNSVTLAWKDIDVFGSSVQKIGQKTAADTQILKNVSGIVKHGELVALMGASGSGKTTLLKTHCLRESNLPVQRNITCNGQKIGNQITSISAYVQQDDIFMGSLTVREHLIFHALLRLPSCMSVREKRYRAEEVLFDLGLSKCQNTRIGISGVYKGISGGEAKRLAFASEILTNPPLLFCDEPTTGLDSFMAENIILVLEKLARRGKTVLCTIHQPASEIYLMFDKVYILGEGRTAFFGRGSEAITFFSNLGYPCPEEFNPADYFIQTLAIVPGEESKCRDRVEKICDEFERSDLYSTTESKICENESSLSADERCTLIQSSQFKNNFILEFSALFCRGAIDNVRNINIAVARPLRKIVLGLLLGLVYSATNYNQQGIQNYSGLLYMTVFEFTMSALWGVLLNIPADWPLLIREHHNGIYRIRAYYLSRIMTFVPVFILDGIVYLCIAYFMAGLRPSASAFFTCMFIGIVTEQVAAAFGVFISCITSSFIVILNIGQPIQIFGWLMGGFFTNINTIPPYMSWLQWIIWFRYSFECLMINQWHDIKSIECTNVLHIECMQTGDEVLKKYGFSADNFGFNIGMMFVLMFSYYTLGYIILCLRIHRSR